MMNTSKRRKTATKLMSREKHDEFLSRISKSLYYAKLPVSDRLSFPVTELAAELFTEVKNGQTLERLDIEEASRISRNACVSPCCLVLALLYLERLKDCNPEYLQRVAPSELFLVSLMVASKFLNDEGEEDEVFNTEWALSGHLSISQMNQLEKDFLQAIDWTVFVNNQDFWERLQKLEKTIAYKEAQKRGWFSYTELTCLMNSMQLLTIAQAVINISSICLATYTAGIVTLLGSALVASYLPGTVLSPRQTTNTTDVTRVNLNPIIDIPTTIIEDAPQNVLRTDFMSTLSHSNDSQQNGESIDSNEVANEHWKWWQNSDMIWLPTHSGLEPKETLHTIRDDIEHTNTFITSTNFVLDTTTLIQDADKMDANWRQILGIDLNLLLHNWRYYANYVTTITLDYNH
ncbi:protein CNPPD1 [Megalopta genalis]|uniref:protein CNPPD1 n=1 Tax=Megalopta genalis TaxID=115081 RepID=UPI00144372D4|nr:protein CNPPD1 [Megalopta genalis]